MPDADAPDVGFGKTRVDLHLLQILGDLEERRRLEARRDRLAHVDFARHDDTRDRRADRGVLEVGAISIDLRRRELLLRDGALQLLLGGIEILFRDVALPLERNDPGEVGAGEIESRHRRRLRSLGLMQCGPVGAIVEIRQHFADANARIEVHLEGSHRSRHLRTDVDEGHRIEGPVGRDGHGDVAALDG